MASGHLLSTKFHFPPTRWSVISAPRFRTIQYLALVVLIVGLILAACATVETELMANSDLSTFTGYLDNRMPKWLQQYQVPGAAVAVVRNGEVAWTSGYGLADEARSVPVTPDTVFQAASISKTVTAWGVMRLVESGQVDLDAPVEQYLSRWHLPSSQYDAGGVNAGGRGNGDLLGVREAESVDVAGG